MKTHFKKMRDPNYIGSWDLLDENGKVVNRLVRIVKVEKQTVHDGTGNSEQLPVVLLKDLKPLVLNATNMKAIAKATGSNFIEDWVGKTIELTVKKVKAFGEVHDAIRVVEKAPELPELKPEDAENWAKCIGGIKSGYTIAQIKGVWKLSSVNEAKLIQDAKV
jgi:hypothetical protein